MFRRLTTLGLTIAGTLLPLIAYAAGPLYSLPQPISSAGTGLTEALPPLPGRDLPVWGFIWDSAYGIGYKIVSIIMSFVGIGLFASYAYAAFLWMTSLGGEQTKKAKTIIVEATIGLVVTMLSYVLVKTIMQLRG